MGSQKSDKSNVVSLEYKVMETHLLGRASPIYDVS